MRINDFPGEDEERLKDVVRYCYMCGCKTLYGVHLPECPRCTDMKRLQNAMRPYKNVIAEKFPVRSSQEIVNLDERIWGGYAKTC